MLAVVILAAGKGTRMKSDLPKVLHTLAGQPLLSYTLDLAQSLEAGRVVVVVGHQAPRVKDFFADRPDLRFVIQEPQLGTGHAVMAAAPELGDWKGPVLILCGDVPGLKRETIACLLAAHAQQGNALTVLGMDLPDPGHYGRLVTTPDGQLRRITEFRDASESERAIRQVNAGIYVVNAPDLLAYLPRLTTDNDQKEYYLTDLVELMASAGLKVGFSLCPDPLEVAGVNSKEELEALEAQLAQARG
ncbi:MAG: NTP transferase domain-containing protein [Desulfarculus sp.]|nr:NTP transferase domain-containing protein [Desulfarculus sp.]